MLDFLRPALTKDLLLHVSQSVDNRGAARPSYSDDYKAMVLKLREDVYGSYAPVQVRRRTQGKKVSSPIAINTKVIN